jgi:hypothetical protein
VPTTRELKRCYFVFLFLVFLNPLQHSIELPSTLVVDVTVKFDREASHGSSMTINKKEYLFGQPPAAQRRIKFEEIHGSVHFLWMCMRAY